jgi:hypothetical protein
MEQSTREKTGVFMVLTHDTVDKILADAGVFVSRVNVEKLMSTCKYVVCVQNNPDQIDDETLYGHKEAFLIGTISGVSPSNANGDKMIQFDTYAQFHKRNAWVNGATRTGIAYFDTPTEAKLRVGSYTFKPVKGARLPRTENVTIQTPDFAIEEKPANAMTLDQAKALVAESLGLSFAPKPEPKPESAITPAKELSGRLDMNEAKAVIAKALGLAAHQIEIVIKI